MKRLFWIKPNLFVLAIISAIGSIAFGQEVKAGIISQTEAEHSAYANEFDFIGQLNTNVGACTASLINPFVALTSAHCVRGATVTANTGAFTLLENGVKTASNRVSVVDIIYYKKWFGDVDTIPAAQNDIALVFLKDTPSAAKKPGFVFGVPKGDSSLVYGLDSSGVASFGGIGQKSFGLGYLGPASVGSFWGGTNVVSDLYTATGKVFKYDMDWVDATGTARVTRNTDFLPGTKLEFLPGPGDSGSPIIVGGNIIAGVHSRSSDGTRVNAGITQTFPKGSFGTLGFGTQLDKYKNWIANTVDKYTKYKDFGGLIKTDFPQGTAITIDGTSSPFWDTSTVSLDPAQEFLYTFENTLDTFSDEFDPTLPDVFSESYFYEKFGFVRSENAETPLNVPEPNTIFGLLAAASLGTASALKGKLKQQ